jgi:hypothetical protein
VKAVQMTFLCAQAMGLRLLPAYRKGSVLHRPGCSWKGLMYTKDKGGEYLFIESGAYAPLVDDAQAFALLDKFGLGVNRQSGDVWEAVWFDPHSEYELRINEKGLKRAIVMCVATMQARGAKP